jgi:hypothetical protein
MHHFDAEAGAFPISKKKHLVEKKGNRGEVAGANVSTDLVLQTNT